jgi:hypothetical protein
MEPSFFSAIVVYSQVADVLIVGYYFLNKVLNPAPVRPAIRTLYFKIFISLVIFVRNMLVGTELNVVTEPVLITVQFNWCYRNFL